jgi:hypothetical protein
MRLYNQVDVAGGSTREQPALSQRLGLDDEVDGVSQLSIRVDR